LNAPPMASGRPLQDLADDPALAAEAIARAFADYHDTLLAIAACGDGGPSRPFAEIQADASGHAVALLGIARSLSYGTAGWERLQVVGRMVGDLGMSYALVACVDRPEDLHALPLMTLAEHRAALESDAGAWVRGHRPAA
jgi:hypothetical protein